MNGKPKKNNGWGGYRPGAGGKPLEIPTKRVGIRLTEDEHTQLKALGGSKWIRAQLKRERDEKG